MKPYLFAIFAVLSVSPATADFVTKESFDGVDFSTLPEKDFPSEGQVKKYRVLGDMLIADDSVTRAFEGHVWPQGKVIFAFDGNVDDDSKGKFWVACHLWENGTGIRCAEKTPADRNYIKVVVATLDSKVAGQSVVGFSPGGGHMVLAYWDQRTLVHEIGHALGKAHEHQRTGAGAYLTIDKSNVSSKYLSNLVELPNTRNFIPQMDFDSIMFYWTNAFATDPGKPVIVLKPPYQQFQDSIGEHDVPSENDLKDVKAAYANEVH